MKKLTKEQSQWLIEKIQNIPLAANIYNEDVWYCHDIQEIINECTENEPKKSLDKDLEAAEYRLWKQSILVRERGEEKNEAKVR